MSVNLWGKKYKDQGLLLGKADGNMKPVSSLTFVLFVLFGLFSLLLVDTEYPTMFSFLVLD